MSRRHGATIHICKACSMCIHLDESNYSILLLLDIAVLYIKEAKVLLAWY